MCVDLGSNLGKSVGIPVVEGWISHLLLQNRHLGFKLSHLLRQVLEREFLLVGQLLCGSGAALRRAASLFFGGSLFLLLPGRALIELFAATLCQQVAVT